MQVDFPQPEGPTSATDCPFLTERLKFLSTCEIRQLSDCVASHDYAPLQLVVWGSWTLLPLCLHYPPPESKNTDRRAEDLGWKSLRWNYKLLLCSAQCDFTTAPHSDGDQSQQRNQSWASCNIIENSDVWWRCIDYLSNKLKTLAAAIIAFP